MSPSGPLSTTSLLRIGDLTAADVTTILDTAEQLREIADRPIKKVPTLRGRTVCTLFMEASTRTRISFDIAAKRLSADVIAFSSGGSSVSKGESLKDTALTLDAMGVDSVVLRAPSPGAPVQLSRLLDVPILNAGDGRHQHPTQALLDLFTVRDHLGDLDGLRVAIVGDILHSRVARSGVEALTLMGAEVTLVAPPTLLPTALPWPVRTTGDLDAVLGDLDVLYLLRVQRERMHGGFFPSLREYTRLWGVDARRLDRLPDRAIVMHPGPINRGIELSAEVADSDRQVITEQVTNGIAVRMACLYLLLGGGARAEPAAAAGGGEAGT